MYRIQTSRYPDGAPYIRVDLPPLSHSQLYILDVSTSFHHLYVTADQHLWVADGATHRILKYDLNGKLLDSWGTSGRFPGALGGVHQISVDQDGNLYVAEVNNGRAQKFRPRPGADHGRLVGQPLRFAATSSN